MRHRLWSIHLRAQRPMSGRWAPRLSPTGVRPFTYHIMITDVHTAVRSGDVIKQAVAARSSIGLACKEYVDQRQPGEHRLLLLTPNYSFQFLFNRSFVFFWFPNAWSQLYSKQVTLHQNVLHFSHRISCQSISHLSAYPKKQHRLQGNMILDSPATNILFLFPTLFLAL